MNGVRSTFMRRGYLLTALSALLLLAASSGTASAQSIGFVDSSGTVSETASLEQGAFEGPLAVTIRASGLNRRAADGNNGLGTLTLKTSGKVSIVKLGPTGAPDADSTAQHLTAAGDVDLTDSALDLTGADFGTTGEVVLLVKQHNGPTAGTDAPGMADDNWLDETIKLTLGAGPGVTVSPNVYNVMVEDQHVAPVAKFNAPSFTLTEGSQRSVNLDIVTGRPGTNIPGAITGRTGSTNAVTLQVSNSQMVAIRENVTAGDGCVDGSGRSTGKALVIDLGEQATGTANESTGWVSPANFSRTGRLATDSTSHSIGLLAGDGTVNGGVAADLTFTACARSNFRDAQVTLTILSSGLHERTPSTGNVMVGEPLMITLDSDDAAPTLSFTLTDVTIDEGQSINTVLIAEGTHANDVGQVKLMVEGDAMVDLYHEDTMLEEMDGYVMVDLGGRNQARLTAMSHEDRGLEDGQMAYKAWKLVDGSSDAMIGDDSWFRVDVRGLTAVPALPLIGQLLLALFLMAGGSRLYRRRRD